MNTRGNILGLFEDDYEKENTFLSTAARVVTQAPTAVYEAVAGLGQTVTVTETKVESNGKDNKENPFSKGTIDFKREQAEKDRIKAFYQTLKMDQGKVQSEKERVFEEELNDIITNLPTEQKNRLLHYQASYRDKSVYQRAELRKKLVEEQRKAEKQEKQATIPSPAKQPSALEGAFEGRSGTQGAGQANLSAQAVG